MVSLSTSEWLVTLGGERSYDDNDNLNEELNRKYCNIVREACLVFPAMFYCGHRFVIQIHHLI